MPVTAEKSTATRPASHRKTSAASGYRRWEAAGPIRDGREQEACDPRADEPEQHLMAVPAKRVGGDRQFDHTSEAEEPGSECQQRPAAPLKKKGRNPPRENGGDCAIRRRRKSSICSPRVYMALASRQSTESLNSMFYLVSLGLARRRAVKTCDQPARTTG